MRYGTNLMTLIRQVLVYWTPERIEQEALRRAADNPKASIIAQEVLVFSQIYYEWLDGLLSWLPIAGASSSGQSLRAQMVREQLSELLLTLERRAATAEARAMDYRMRYEFGQLRAVITHNDAITVIERLIREALHSDRSDEDLRKILKNNTSALERLDTDTQKIRLDVDFIADRVTQDLTDKLTSRAELKNLASGLASNTVFDFLKYCLLSL